MTLLIWAGFALTALVWTGGAVAASALIHWSAGLLASGEAAQLGQSVSSLPIPLWLTYWFDIEAIHAALDGIVWTLTSAQQALPWLGTLLQWLLPPPGALCASAPAAAGRRCATAGAPLRPANCSRCGLRVG